MLSIAVIVCASWSTVRLSRKFPLSEKAILSGVPLCVGLSLAPLCLGVVMAVILMMMPGASRVSHLVALFSFMLLFNIMLTTKKRRLGEYLNYSFKNINVLNMFMLFILALFVIILVFASITMPKYLNDALEYRLASKDIFYARNMVGYPGIDSNLNRSGFYYSWTHPPVYVSLLYLFEILSNGFSGSWSINFINPWVTIVNTMLIYSCGCVINRHVAIIAAILFISTPLYFLGSIGGLIDPLPILGVSLVAGSILYCIPGAPGTSRMVGFLVGLTLWTHSISVLFLPIAIVCYFWNLYVSQVAGLIKNIITASIVSVGVGSYPYIKNFLNIGSIVSDSPPVVCLPNLRWEEFYDYSRGIASWGAKVQYGLFKGLFAPEAYGILFILFAVGLSMPILLIFMCKKFTAIIEELCGSNIAKIIYTLCIFNVLYLIGIFLSIFVGNTLIKNERYMLVIIGPSAIMAAITVYVAGKFILHCICSKYGSSPYWKYCISCVFCLFAVVSLLVSVIYLWTPRSGYSFESWKRYPNLLAIEWINSHVPSHDRVLSFRPGDFYYANVRVMSHLDSQLLDVYKSQNKYAAVRRLEALGIRWIHMSDYTPPTVYNSAMSSIVADKNLSRLLYSADGQQVYSLLSNGISSNKDMFKKKSRKIYKKYVVVNFGGRKQLYSPVVAVELLDNSDVVSSSGLPFDLFNRHFSSYIATGTGKSLLESGELQYLDEIEADEFSINLTLSGNAYVQIFAVQYDPNGRIIRGVNDSAKEFVGEIVLIKGERRNISHRLLRKNGAMYVKVLVLHHGNSWIRLHSMDILSYV